MSAATSGAGPVLRAVVPGVPFRVRIAYALPAFALAVVGIPIYVYLPKFYTDVLGVEIGALGAVLLAARAFDALTDPLIGGLSDRSMSRWGRRRPWIAAAALPLALSIWLLFVPPELSPSAALVWFAAAIFALFLCWTAVAVPYESLGPEISFDYDERTSLLGLRDGMLILGTLAAAASPAVVGAALGVSADAEGERRRFFWIAALYVPLLLAACAWCIAIVREPLHGRNEIQPPWREGLRAMGRNRPFVILLTSYTIAAFGSNLPATLILYYVQYVLRSDNADIFLLLYFVTGILFLPLWVMLSRRAGKKQAWIVSMGINTGAFLGVFFLGPGDEAAYGVLVVLSGVGLGATIALPSAMQADVIDYDEMLSGRRREGQYVGVWAVSRKLAAALGVGVALPLLGAVGYQPNIEQPPAVLMTLRVLYCLVPCACNLAAIVVALAYPIDRRRHEEIRAAIEARALSPAVDGAARDS